MEFTGAILTGRKSGGGVAGRRHDHYYYPLFFCLDIGREEGMEGRKGAFTAMLDTRTLGVGTEDGNSSGSWVVPLEHSSIQHTRRGG
jgi:hypothetical protein